MQHLVAHYHGNGIYEYILYMTGPIKRLLGMYLCLIITCMQCVRTNEDKVCNHSKTHFSAMSSALPASCCWSVLPLQMECHNMHKVRPYSNKFLCAKVTNVSILPVMYARISESTVLQQIS